MYWYGQFKSKFFEMWTRAGLPPAEGYEESYTTALRAIRFTSEHSRGSSMQRDPLDPDILNAVYGFGTLFGRICGDLLGLSNQVVVERSEWCGRFNLGISLLDYLCDEANRMTTVVTLPAFRPFFSPTSAAPKTLHSLGPTEELLNELAGGLIAELKLAIFPINNAHRHADLWHALKEAFKAEITVVVSSFHSDTDLTRMRKALRLKSREPFRVMAEWMAYGSTLVERQSLLKQSRDLGRALGQCFWLMDDAKDVWADLDSDRWNLFLLHAITVEPQFFRQTRNPILDLRLMQMWERDDLIERLSRSTVRQLVKSLAPLQISSHEREQALGFVAASLARW